MYFPITFSNTNYVLIVPNAGTVHNVYSYNLETKATSNFRMQSYEKTTTSFGYLAIGT